MVAFFLSFVSIRRIHNFSTRVVLTLDNNFSHTIFAYSYRSDDAYSNHPQPTEMVYFGFISPYNLGPISPAFTLLRTPIAISDVSLLAWDFLSFARLLRPAFFSVRQAVSEHISNSSVCSRPQRISTGLRFHIYYFLYLSEATTSRFR